MSNAHEEATAEVAYHLQEHGLACNCSINWLSGVIATAVMAVADREQAELRDEVERWKDKANESGAAYANANSKHHAEWERANRLEASLRSNR